jgi:uncharacterized delta-60 repeat protein
MPNRGVLALACLVACDGGAPSGDFLTLSVRRFVDIPRSTGMGTLQVQAVRANLNDEVSFSLEDPPQGLLADPLELPAGTTAANWTMRAATPIDSDVTIVARSTSGLVTRSHTHVKSDLVGGLLDESFGEHGITASLAGSQWGCASALGQPDATVIITSMGDTATAGSVLRVTADGVLDPAYGVGGMATIPTPPGHGTDVVRGVLQPDGKLLAFGYERFNDATHAFFPRVWRLQPDGSLDDTFHLDTRFSDRLDDTIQYAALRADGEVDVVLGTEFPNIVVDRLATDGSLDAEFGIGGGAQNPIAPLLVLEDGNWLGIDYREPPGAHVEIVTTTGILVAMSEPVPANYLVVVRPATGGFLFALGTADYPSSYSIVLRLRSDLSLDPSFGAGGSVQADFPIEDMSLTSDGKVVIEGNGTLERLNPDGSPDSTFRLDAVANLYDLFGGSPACQGGLIVDRENRITLPFINAAHELRLVRFLP